MILYFSATGNTEFVAKEIARMLDDQCIDLLPKIRSADYSEIHSDKTFVICTPIYYCEMPNFVNAFLKKVKLTGNKNVYFVFTSGGYSGCASSFAKSYCRKRKLVYKGTADIQMPRNYIASNMYPMQDSETCKQLISSAKEKIAPTVEKIKAEEFIQSRHVYLFEILAIVPVAVLWINFVIKTKKFITKDSCIGCGKCSKVCPLNNIQMIDKKPVWGKKCTHCMACICNCPKDSIEYGTITVGKDRYLFKKLID